MAYGKRSPDKKLTVKMPLDSPSLGCLTDARFRDKAKRVLIETAPYFRTEERIALCSMLRLDPAAADKLRKG